MSALQLLIVEDSLLLQEVYRDILQDPRLNGHFKWTLAISAGAAIRALHRQPPNIVILDWMLPDKDGMSVLEAIRSDPKARGAMVFVVTNLSSKDKEIEALRLGADDFLRKPFDREVLVERLFNLAKRLMLPPERQETVRLRDLRLEMPFGRLWVGSKAVELHRKEAELLSIFLKRPDMVHSAAYLWDVVWGYASADYKNTLRATLSNLRKKLGSRWSQCLESIKDQGYVFSIS